MQSPQGTETKNLDRVTQDAYQTATTNDNKQQDTIVASFLENTNNETKNEKLIEENNTATEPEVMIKYEDSDEAKDKEEFVNNEHVSVDNNDSEMSFTNIDYSPEQYINYSEINYNDQGHKKQKIYIIISLVIGVAGIIASIVLNMYTKIMTKTYTIVACVVSCLIPLITWIVYG